VVHGSGLDEFALHGDTHVVEVNGDKITESDVSPADFGLENHPLDAIKGGEPEENKTLIEDVLIGKGQPAHQAAVAMNTAALLKLCGKVKTYALGAEMAIKAMQQQRPFTTIKLSAAISQNK
jgi:anthranilate phosphoribosyltransferase